MSTHRAHCPEQITDNFDIIWVNTGSGIFLNLVVTHTHTYAHTHVHARICNETKSINDISEVRCLCRAQRILKDYPAQPQPVQPAAIWQDVQQYPAEVSWDIEAVSFFRQWHYGAHPSRFWSFNDQTSFMIYAFCLAVWGATSTISLLNIVLKNDNNWSGILDIY